VTVVRLIHRSAETIGLAPGTATYLGEPSDQPLRVTVLDYDERSFTERVLDRPEESFAFRDSPSVSWINVDGLHDVAAIEAIAGHFGLHPLVVEDVLHTGQRSKAEDYDDTLFIVLRMLSYNESTQTVDDEQVSLVLGKRYVLSLQQRVGDVFDGVRERIRNSKGRIRRAGADYLAYSLVDAVVDQYFVVLERLGEQVEVLGEEVSEHADRRKLEEIRRLKRELLFLRKSIWPLREVLSRIQRGESPLFDAHTLIYLRDVYDHTIQVIDTVETYRDMMAGLLDVFMTSVSNRMNEVMKVLTIIATIFIPLSFVAGLYGMNFKYMPELSWRYGYFGALGVMAAVAGGMLVYFKRKGWF
jgi:magnesium transporter